jgi:hypothetical protein
MFVRTRTSVAVVVKNPINIMIMVWELRGITVIVVFVVPVIYAFRSFVLLEHCVFVCAGNCH